MTTPEDKTRIEITRKRGTSWGRLILIVLIMAALAWFVKSRYLGGNGGPEQAQMQAPPPIVVVQQVGKADLALSREYIGKVEPIQVVALKPQVSGEIKQVHFKEGAFVKAGTQLFSLDADQYQATVALRKADLAQAEASVERARKYYDRLKAADARSVPASEIDMAESDLKQGQAAVEQAKASLRLAQIDLNRARIAAPISGQIGKAFFTKGNYVTPQSGNLAEIVQLDPIRVTFSLPDRDYLEQMSVFRNGDEAVYDATILLADGTPYPFQGERDFEDNMIDTATGSIQMRLRFPNADGLLVPGAMVRVSTKPAQSRIAVVIPMESVLADSVGDYVYVVDADNVAHQQRVALGGEVGVMREVLSGLNGGETIVVRGHQSVRPESPVNPSRTRADESKAPSELAKESGYDLTPLSADTGDAGRENGEER